jgi:glycosyltransferase involved in cell wall biosynthesis
VTPHLLDISRLISRVGNGPHTGIDRVELAYFRELLAHDEPVFFLCRLPRSYSILDAVAGQQVFAKITGNQKWGRRGLAKFLIPRVNPTQQAAISDIWRLATARCTSRDLVTCIRKQFPAGTTYFNVGHSNLREKVFSAIKSHTNSSIIILIHDIIPLTYSEYSTPSTAQNFRSSMQLVARMADKVIYNSKATQIDAEQYFSNLGRVPPGISAHLGIDPLAIPQIVDNPPKTPQFVILGTIEPRKNHALLLEIWRGYIKTLASTETPTLHIIGKRGWKNTGVFNILDNDPMMDKHVFEHNNLDDKVTRQMLAASHALLFPSFAEGFGLPLIEAAAMGVPIICGDNAIYRELLGDYPLYLNVDNSYVWSKRILGRAGRKRESDAERQVRASKVKIPTWDQHFDQIFRFV